MEARLKISIIVPALNEAEGIAAVLAGLAPLRNRGHEVIVVDGGSSDNTRELARTADRVISAPRGRASQMNAGAALVFRKMPTRASCRGSRRAAGHGGGSTCASRARAACFP